MSINGQDYARTLLRKLKINSLPIRPKEIAKQLDITIKECDAGDDFDGCLVSQNGLKGILLNNRISYEPRRNFTIAHEIGHSEMPDHLELERKCSESDINIMFGQRQPENEANEFAAELLMPEFYMSEEVSFREICIDEIKKISETCETSLTSSALQYIKYCPEIAAIIVSENSKIKYFARTKDAENEGLFFNPGTSISKVSVAAEFVNSSGIVIASGKNRDEVDPRIWCPEMDYSKYKCLESVIALPKLNQVISLLYFEELYD